MPASTPSARVLRMAALVFAAVALLELVALTGVAPPPHEMLRAGSLVPFVACGLLVAFLVLLRSRPRVFEVAMVLAVAAPLGVWMGRPMAPISALQIAVVAGASLGEASLLVLALRVATTKGAERRRALDVVAMAALVPGFILTTGPVMALTSTLYPVTYDGAAYTLDSGLGFEPSFVVGRAFLASNAFQLPCVLAYGCLPFSFGVLLLLPPRAGLAPPRADLLESFLLAGVIGFALYNACPVAGPYYVFGDAFPSALPTLVSSAPFAIPPAPRNAVPSLHAGWAILAFWHARSRGPAVHTALGISMVLVLLGALGLGEHYVGDFVVAVPFVVAVDALATHGVPLARAERWQPIATGAVLVAAWILLLRNAAGWFGAHMSVTCALMIAYVAAPLALRARLQRCAADDS